MVLLMQQRLANNAEWEREFTSPSVNGLEKDFYLTYFNNLNWIQYAKRTQFVKIIISSYDVS